MDVSYSTVWLFSKIRKKAITLKNYGPKTRLGCDSTCRMFSFDFYISHQDAYLSEHNSIKEYAKVSPDALMALYFLQAIFSRLISTKVLGICVRIFNSRRTPIKINTIKSPKGIFITLLEKNTMRLYQSICDIHLELLVLKYTFSL